MKNKYFVPGFLLGLMLMLVLAAVPVANLVLQTDMNAGAHSITNVVSITDTNGNPITGGSSTNLTAAAINATQTNSLNLTNTANIIAGNGTGLTNTQAGSFNATGTNVINSLSTAAAQAVMIEPSNIIYVAPWGSESNNGHYRASPWGNIYYAENFGSNLIASGAYTWTLTKALTGTNYNGLTNAGQVIYTMPGMNYEGEAGSMLVLTNIWTGVNVAHPPLIGVASNQVWNNFWVTVKSGTSAANAAGQVNIGAYENEVGVTNVDNCTFNGGGINGSSQGAHFEGVTNLVIKMSFINFYMQSLNPFVCEFNTNVFIRMEGCYFKATNWYNIANTGTEYGMKIGNAVGPGYLSIKNSTIDYTDQGNNSKASCAINSQAVVNWNYTNALTAFNGVTIIANAITNPASFDVYNLSNITNTFTGIGLGRIDGLPISETNTVWPGQAFVGVSETNFSWAGWP